MLSEKEISLIEPRFQALGARVGEFVCDESSAGFGVDQRRQHRDGKKQIKQLVSVEAAAVLTLAQAGSGRSRMNSRHTYLSMW